MLNIIYCEFLKFKRSKFLLIIICTFSIFSSICLSTQIRENNSFIWENYLGNTFILNNMFLFISIFTLITAYTFIEEYKNKTLYNLFTYPMSRIKIFMAKLIVILLIIVGSELISYLICILLGLIFIDSPLTLNTFTMYLKSLFLSTISNFCLIPIIATLCILSKNIIIPIIFGLSVCILNPITLTFKYNIFFPFSIPLLVSNYNIINLKFHISFTYIIVVLTITFLLGLILSITMFTNQDID